MLGDRNTLVIHLSPDNILYLTRGEVGRFVQLLQRGVSPVQLLDQNQPPNQLSQRDQPPDPLLTHLDWNEAANLAAELQAFLSEPAPHDWAKEGF